MKNNQNSRNSQNNQNNSDCQDIVIIGSDVRFARMLELELKNNGYACRVFNIAGSNINNINNGGNGGDKRYLFADALNCCFETGCNFVILAIGEISGSYIEFMKLANKSAINIAFVSFENVINDFREKTAGKEYSRNIKNNIIFIKRPFIIEQFIKEIAAFQKKINKIKTAQPKIIRIGDLTIDETSKSVAFGEDKIELTKKEYDLLIFLIKNRGEAVDRKRIFVEVWGFDYYGSTNVVDVFVRYLRNKIDQKYKIKLIHTVRGIGYTIRK